VRRPIFPEMERSLPARNHCRKAHRFQRDKRLRASGGNGRLLRGMGSSIHRFAYGRQRCTDSRPKPEAEDISSRSAEPSPRAGYPSTWPAHPSTAIRPALQRGPPPFNVVRPTLQRVRPPFNVIAPSMPPPSRHRLALQRWPLSLQRGPPTLNGGPPYPSVATRSTHVVANRERHWCGRAAFPVVQRQLLVAPGL
jgi:hypothetical protein